MLIKREFERIVKKIGDSAYVGGMTYRQFGEEVKKAGKKLNKNRIVFAEGTRFEQAVIIFAAFITGKTVVPIAKEYGVKRNESIVKKCMNTKIPRGIAAILFTSGSEGEPKGVLLSERALLRNVKAISDYMGENRRKIAILRPLVHSAVFTGELLFAVLHGWDVTFWEKSFFPTELCAFLWREHCDVAGMTPTMLRTFIRLRAAPQLREIILSGERLFPREAETFSSFLPQCSFYSVYGLTECGPRVSALSPYLVRSFPGSVGKPVTGVKIKIQHGQLLVKSPCQMKGYLDDKQKSRQKKSHGWIKTGDMAECDKFGNLYILGRMDDMIIRAGMNLYPAEIENIILRCEGISECVAYGLEGECGVRIILEYVGTAAQEDVAAYAVKELPPYLVPQAFYKKQTLEKTASGKLVRKKPICFKGEQK